jgi:CheY-like chemotaxis protein
MIDDSLGVLEDFRRPLEEICGEGSGQYHFRGDIEKALAHIEAFIPEVILMDYYLAASQGIKGSELIPLIRERMSENCPRFIGFSSMGHDPEIREAFLGAGAEISFTKNRAKPFGCLREVLTFLGKDV